MVNEPLGLPQGTVRALIAVGVIGAAIFAELTGHSNVWLQTLAGAAFGYYFAQRMNESQTKEPNQPLNEGGEGIVISEDEDDVDTSKLVSGK